MSRPLPLAGVALGAGGTAAALAALFLGARQLMVEHGGSCSSGGPYQVAPGHACTSTEIWALGAAPFAGLLLTWLLVAASDAWSDDRIGGVGSLVWAATFGALGWNFLDLAIRPPAGMSGTGGWIVCGVVFWAMALGGLAYARHGLDDYFFPGDGPEPGTAPAPLVRAAVTWTEAPVDWVTPSTTVQTLAPSSTTVGSPWLWLATVLTAASAGAAAVAVLW